jgi:FMN reductase [NAD(P)H]
MNTVVSSLTDHRSIRQYKDTPISPEQLDAIIAAAQAAPSSINGQQVTIIGIQDKERKARIAQLCGNQPWIEQAPLFLLFCADFYRASIATDKNEQPLAITSGMESIIVGTCDVGLSMGFAIAAAESMGLGIVPIGAVRSQPLELIKFLDLPKFVFPVAGLVVGYPADRSEKKPRLPREAVYHHETYNHDLRSLIDQYDKEYEKYLAARDSSSDKRNWSKSVSEFYTRIYYPEIRPMLEQQGFDFK